MSWITKIKSWFNSTIESVKTRVPIDVIKQNLKVTSIAVAPFALPLKVVATALAYIAKKIQSKKRALAVAASLASIQFCEFQKFYEAMVVIRTTPSFLIISIANLTITDEDKVKGCHIYKESFNYAAHFLENCLTDRPEFEELWQDSAKMLVATYELMAPMCHLIGYRKSLRTNSECGLKEKETCLGNEEFLSYTSFSSDVEKLLLSKEDVGIDDVGNICCKAENYGNCARKSVETFKCDSIGKNFNKEMEKNGTNVIKYFCKKHSNRKCTLDNSDNSNKSDNSDKSSAKVIHPLMLILYSLEIIVSRVI